MRGWTVVALVGGVTVVFKALGPVVLGGRPLPARLDGALTLLAPAVLAALVVTQTFASGTRLVLDERAIGVGAAAVLVAAWRRAPTLLVIGLAAAVTAGARLLA
jgi:branched-subunit amino acid transport protein